MKTAVNSELEYSLPSTILTQELIICIFYSEISCYHTNRFHPPLLID